MEKKQKPVYLLTKEEKRQENIKEYLREVRENRTEEEDRFYMDALRKTT